MSFLRRQLITLWEDINSSYWFLPLLMTIGGVLLSYLLIWLGGFVDLNELKDLNNLEWLALPGPDGARAVLSTLAGSTITVAGVVFSMTLLAVSHASSQIGPRILAGFMTDRGNQITLGTFIATFVYSLLILGHVHEKSHPGGGDPVPQLALLGAMALAFFSVAVLIYFIHHVPRSISMTTAVSQVGNDFLVGVRSLHPGEIGEDFHPEEGQVGMPSDFRERSCEVLADGKGYFRKLDSEKLLELATKNDLVVEIIAKPGDFISNRVSLFRVYPSKNCSEELLDDIRKTMAWGTERGLQKDANFSANLLVEVAARALSPGVNDPFTAKECICQLQAGLGAMLMSEEPTALRQDSKGRLRVFSTPLTFEVLGNRVFDLLRPYSKKDPIAAEQIFNSLRFLKTLSRRAENTKVLDSQAEALWVACCQEMEDERDLANLRIVKDRVLIAEKS